MKGKRIVVRDAEQIKVLVNKERNTLIRTKLVFLNFLANFHRELDKICEIFGIAESTGYLWVRQWNEEGYEGIKSKGKRTGRPSFLPEDNMKKLNELLKEKPYWTTKEVRELIASKFEVTYSEDQVVRILRDKLKICFSKPHSLYYKTK
ncbi:MAG: transposase [wastewater metagenome]|nr:transposase [Candidatus Loosdrechtia aerotolerans]